MEEMLYNINIKYIRNKDKTNRVEMTQTTRNSKLMQCYATITKMEGRCIKLRKNKYLCSRVRLCGSVRLCSRKSNPTV